jgi:hypothetical protein
MNTLPHARTITNGNQLVLQDEQSSNTWLVNIVGVIDHEPVKMTLTQLLSPTEFVKKVMPTRYIWLAVPPKREWREIVRQAHEAMLACSRSPSPGPDCSPAELASRNLRHLKEIAYG